MKSRPTRARGLKPQMAAACVYMEGVAPHAGAWIETLIVSMLSILGLLSRPTRARGLKRDGRTIQRRHAQVAPHAGAWIETRSTWSGPISGSGRAPRGRVD